MTIMRYFMRLMERQLPPIRVVTDDSDELAPTSAAEFKRRTGEIVVRQKWRHNEPLINHEIGHALLDHVQPPMWHAAFDDHPDAWAEFLDTSVARSYQQRESMTPDEANDPRSYDWVEAGADLYMVFKAGKLADSASLRRLLLTFIT